MTQQRSAQKKNASVSVSVYLSLSLTAVNANSCLMMNSITDNVEQEQTMEPGTSVPGTNNNGEEMEKGIKKGKRKKEEHEGGGNGEGTMENKKKRKGNEEEEEEDQREEDEEDKRMMLDLVSCPVCMDLAIRDGKEIHTCGNGHMVCGKCFERLAVINVRGGNGGRKACPTCRNTDMRPCKFATELAKVSMRKAVIECRFSHSGCGIKGTVEQLAVHEERCSRREISCPSGHRGACKWIGPLNKMFAHLKEKTCMQVIREYPRKNTFQSFIGDFVEAGSTVFERRAGHTYWKPVLLVSKEATQYLIYVNIFRCPGGRWFLFARSLARKSVASKLKIAIRVFSIPSADEGSIQIEPALTYGFEGGVNSASDTDSDILKGGKYLMLCDEQVKSLRTNRGLFGYRIEITPTPKEEEEDQEH